MSTPPPATEDVIEDPDYIGEEEDEEDEDEFVPGGGDDDDGDDGDDASSTVVPLLDGHLFYGAKHALHYQGEGFHLSASDPVPWNFLDSKVKPRSNEFELIMSGPCDFETAGAKATPRTMKVTFSVLTGFQNSALESNGISRKKRAAPPSPSADVTHVEPDGKQRESAQDSKAPSLYYRVCGRQVDSHGGDLMEFMGGFHPPSNNDDEGRVGLVCQVRMIVSDPTKIEHKPPPAAAAAAVAAAAAARVDQEDEDEISGDEGDADEDVSYNELIALHEDAGMSVADLKRRFQKEDETDNNANVSDTPRRTTRKAKKLKQSPPSSDEEDCDGF